MNLLAVDMNLLAMLDALLRERHVGRAATAVGRSQPAMSHALSRLRALFDDPLLVQSGRRMVLSPRAEGLRKPLARVLREAGLLFTGEAFDPASCSRSFRLMLPDCIAADVVPPLMSRIVRDAPGVRLDIAEWRGARTLSREFLDGIDLILSLWAGRFADFQRERLFADRDVVAVRAASKTAARVGTLRGFLAAPQVAVIGPGEHEDVVDSWLRSLGHVRRIVATVPTYLLALGIVARSDFVAMMPARLMAEFGRHLRLRALRPPLDPGVDEIFLHYPAVAAADPASLWLRALVRDVERR